jgi:hypothetical protein
LHFAIHNGAEEALPLMSAEGDEIGTGSGVILPLQPNRLSMMFVWVVFHEVLPMHLIDRIPVYGMEIRELWEGAIAI